MSKRGDPCRCPRHDCRNLTAESKWALCRPCAIGNHYGGICGSFQQERWVPHQCKVCGHDLVDHQMGAE